MAARRALAIGAVAVVVLAVWGLVDRLVPPIDSGLLPQVAYRAHDDAAADFDLVPEAPEPSTLLVGDAAAVGDGTSVDHGQLVIEVLSVTGAAVPGAHLTVSSPDGRLMAQGRTASDGLWELNVEGGPVRARLDRTGAVEELHIVAGHRHQMVFRMVGGVHATVTVLRPDGDPAAGALVWLSRGKNPAVGDVVSATDSAGVVELASLQPGQVLLGYHPRFTPSRPVELVAEPYRQQCVLRLGPAGSSLRGVVLDERDSPLPAATVRIYANGLRQWQEAKPVECFVAEDGRFESIALPAGEAYVEVVAPARVPFRRMVMMPLDEELAVRLEKGHVISGMTADPHGRPVPDVLIRAFTADAGPMPVHRDYSGEGGLYQMTGVAPGRVTLVATRMGTRDVTRDVVVGGSVPTVVDLVVPDASRVAGTVVERTSGSPLADWRVLVESPSGTAVGSTDRNGRFRLWIEGARCTIRVLRPGTGPRFPMATVEGWEPGSREVRIEVDVPKASASIAGDIQDLVGLPERVVARLNDRAGRSVRSWVVSPVDGAFEESGLEAGSYSLRITAGRELRAAVRVILGPAEFLNLGCIPLLELSRLRVEGAPETLVGHRIRDHEGRWIATLSHEPFDDSLPGGTYVVMDQDDEVVERLDLRPGETSILVLE